MRAAVVTDFARPPAYSDFREPAPSDGRVVVDVEASAVHRVVRSIAAGAHYSSGDALPMVPGVDGVARLADGSRVYTGGCEDPWGMLAERAAVPAGWAVPVPDGLDSGLAAAIVNPAMSGWIPLAEHLPEGGTVLVLGATGASGGLALRAARLLGAGRVVAAGRSRAALDRLDADAVLTYEEDPVAALAAAADGYDVVLDYVWAEPARRILRGLAANGAGPDRPTRWVQIGATAGEELALPASVLRGAAIRLSGSGLGTIDPAALFRGIPAILEAAARGDLTLDVEEHPLSEVEATWDRPDRLVYRP